MRWRARATLLLLAILLLVINVLSVRGNGANVRLVDGSSPYDGLVEMYVNDTTGWLPVCGTKGVWKFVDANVVCNQLGYNGTMRSKRENGLLRNDPRRVVDQVACTANSINIDDCQFSIEEPGHCNDTARITCNFDGYIGCFNSNASDPVLPDDEQVNNQMTIQWCLDYCRERNWTYAGLHWRKYCHCGRQGTDYARQGASRCVSTCRGNNQQICGGGKDGKERISIYKTHLGAFGGQVNVTGSRTIYSPGFPGYYPNSQDCTWTLSSSNANNFMMSFVFLNLNNTDDNIALYDVIDGKRIIILQFRGSDAPEVIFSCSNKVLVDFHSGNSNTSHSGMFVLTFKEVYTACPLPREIKHGHLNVLGDCTKNWTLSVICNEGLNVNTSHSNVVCYEGHGWNDTIPNCTVIDCGEPDEVPNASKEGNLYTYKNTVKYSCNDGYYMDGHDVITCEEDGNWSKQPTCILNDTELIGQIPKNASTGMIVGVLFGILVTVAFITINLILYRRKRYCYRHIHKLDFRSVTEGFAARDTTGGESNDYDKGTFDGQEYETISDAVKVDHASKMNIAEPFGKANVDGTNDSPSRGTAVESPHERDDTSSYEQLDPKACHDNLYFGLTKYEEIRKGEDILCSREESVAMSAYEPIRPSLLCDNMYNSLQKNKVDNSI